ncbi:MAG TPA: hypothetical protein PLU80_20470, partial [Acidobacteriota bacterium]|nr:hypothetical protein [Acidobacteriota bacterium]
RNPEPGTRNPEPGTRNPNCVMPEPKLIIRKESLPSRCEICHQSDLLDLETGQCQRCTSVVQQLNLEKARPAEPEIDEQTAAHIRTADHLITHWILKLFMGSLVTLLMCIGGCLSGVYLAGYTRGYFSGLGLVLLGIGILSGTISVLCLAASFLLACAISIRSFVEWVARNYQDPDFRAR